MKYRTIILCALLFPRLDFLEIPGVNSSMRLDVLALAIVSALPVFVSLSYSNIFLACTVILMSCFQILLFDAQITRIVIGLILYVSIILFSQYHKIISVNDVIHICRWFLIVNSIAHLSDMFFTVSFDHNFSGRYGVFNQHFAFASAILISYFFLYYHNARDKWVDALFIVTFLLSGSRGLIVAVGLCLILANLNIIKNLRNWVMVTFFLPLIIAGGFFFVPENVHLVRLVVVFNLLIESFSANSTILLDPAVNVRVENIYRYFEYVKALDNSTLYMMIGGGPYSFLDYSIQYQKPGHFDNLYFRILSEYGIVALVFIITLLLVCVRRSRRAFWYVIALLIGAMVSEAILTLKVAHLFFLTLLFLKKPNAKNS